MTWALVQWAVRREPGVHLLAPSWQFFASRDRAQMAAPTDRPFSVVNVARKARHPNIDDLLARTRLIDCAVSPYNHTSLR